jgi:hypothetical protein
MHPRFERHGHRILVAVGHARRVDGKPRPIRLGSLGTVSAAVPLSVNERVAFWGDYDRRWCALVARHPSLVSPADADKVRAKIAKRIPRPAGEAELRRLRSAAALSDLVGALAAFDGNDQVTNALLRITALARESQRQKEPGKPTEQV